MPQETEKMADLMKIKQNCSYHIKDQSGYII
jgi:hypothetical protein